MNAQADQAAAERNVGKRLRLLGFAIRAATMLAVEALTLVVVTALLPGNDALSFSAALLVALAMALINALLWPIITRLALPLTIITFGLSSLALSAGTVAVAFYWVDGKTPSFWWIWPSQSHSPSSRWWSRLCSTWTAMPFTYASSGAGSAAEADRSQAMSQV